MGALQGVKKLQGHLATVKERTDRSRPRIKEHTSGLSKEHSSYTLNSVIEKAALDDDIGERLKLKSTTQGIKGPPLDRHWILKRCTQGRTRFHVKRQGPSARCARKHLVSLASISVGTLSLDLEGLHEYTLDPPTLSEPNAYKDLGISQKYASEIRFGFRRCEG